MNAFDPNLAGQAGAAELRYGDAEYRIVRPGRYVICAVSGARIPLEALRYWNPTLQEAYAGPKEALQRFRELEQKAG